MYPIDIRFDIELECEVKQDGFRPSLLRSLLAASRVLQAKKDLKFFVTDTDVPPPFTLLWKVLNRGPTAVRRDCIRGEIVPDDGRLEKIERTNFRGDHIVECYAVKDGVVVAKDRIHVPITE
ncbi:hypothetical protein DA075_17295 [Methylobacterium currus]|nr:hypothetical protein DA075_17295 [Methylobacterium currus]